MLQNLLDEGVTELARIDKSCVGDVYCEPFASFDFDEEKNRTWQLMWVQWGAIYLTDELFVDFFERAACALDEGGLIVVKENVLLQDQPPHFDEDDSSVTRCDAHYKMLFDACGLEVMNDLWSCHAQYQAGGQGVCTGRLAKGFVQCQNVCLAAH